MNERRAEQRWMCSDLVTVQLENQDLTMVANLEDISPSGACLELEQAVPREAMLVMDCSNCRFRGKVKYCVVRQGGYQVGVHFTECKWSKEKYAPAHLLDGPVIQAGDLATLLWDSAKAGRLVGDLARLPRPCCEEATCPRAEISRVIEPESPLDERIRVVARAVAWTCEKLGAEDLKRCFSRWFQLPPECMLCEEFGRAYHEEFAAVSSQPASQKRLAAGGASNGV